jgi:hypothetical protein
MPPGFRWGSGSGSDHGGPLLCGRAREPPPAGPCARVLARPGMMATGAASELTQYDVALRKAAVLIKAATHLRARTCALFPGARGQAYRAPVIGTRAYRDRSGG